MIGIVLGTRPEIIKLAPIMYELQSRNTNFVVFHTNQHYDSNMDSDFLDELYIPKANIIRYPSKFALGAVTDWLMGEFQKNDIKLVIVEGDTNSVLAGSIAAMQLHIDLAHVEAGLRSRDTRMLEEYNRIITDNIAKYLFCPTDEAKYNLELESLYGIVVGNTISDMVNLFKDNLPNNEKDYILLTMHRSENVDDKIFLEMIIDSINYIYNEYKINFIFPIHPRTKKKLEEFNLKLPECVEIIEPVSFEKMLNYEKNARLIISDSGGLQEEAAILGVPCITIRKTTERPETVSCGANILAITKDEVLNAVKLQLENKRQWKHPYGEGVAARIVDIIQ